MPRSLRIGLQLLVTGALLAYLAWRIDVRRTASLVADVNVLPIVVTLVVFVASTWALAWRWQLLLASKGIREPLGWLAKLYFVGQAASQVLPTAIGGDAVRIVEHARRRPRVKGEVAAAVLLERAAGAAATLALVALGLVLAAASDEDVRIFVWIEALLVAGTAAAAFLVFARRARPVLSRLGPLARRLRIGAPARSLYLALHGYRERPGVLTAVTSISLAIQVIRVLGMWLCGVAVGVDVSPLAYFVLGPLLFLVMLVPFTLNGIGVREAFFVAFLGRFGVGADPAFATGFLFFAVTIAAALPGAVVVAWERARPTASAAPP